MARCYKERKAMNDMQWQLRELADYCKRIGAEFPQLEGELQDTFNLAKDEVCAGESPTNETELAYSYIQTLIDRERQKLGPDERSQP